MPEASPHPGTTVQPTSGARGAALALGGALIALPWSYRLSWDSNHAAPLLLLPALVLGGRELAHCLGELRRASMGLRIVALALFACTALAVALSAHAPISLVTAAGWMLCFAAALLARQLVKTDPASPAILLGAMALSGSIATVLHAWRWAVTGDPYTSFYVFTRLMGLHLLSATVAATAMVLRTRKATLLARCTWLAVAAIAWAGLFWTGSRSPLIGLGVALAVWWIATEHAERLRLFLTSLGLSIAGLALSACFWTELPAIGWWQIGARSAPSLGAKAITSHRSDFWAKALEHVPASPWFGHGPEAYNYLRPALEGAQPHNLPIQLVLDLGLPGAACAAILLLAALAGGWRARANAATATPVFLGLALGTLAASQFDGYFFYPLSLIPTALAFGVCCIGVGKTEPSPIPTSSTSRFVWPTLAAVTVVLLAHAALFQAVARGPAPTSPDSLVARAWRAFPSVTFNVDLWVDAWERTHPDAALATSRLAAQYAPNSDFFRVKTALLFARRGDHRQAVTELELALRDALPTQREPIEGLLKRARAAAGQP